MTSDPIAYGAPNDAKRYAVNTRVMAPPGDTVGLGDIVWLPPPHATSKHVRAIAKNGRPMFTSTNDLCSNV